MPRNGPVVRDGEVVFFTDHDFQQICFGTQQPLDDAGRAVFARLETMLLGSITLKHQRIIMLDRKETAYQIVNSIDLLSKYAGNGFSKTVFNHIAVVSLKLRMDDLPKIKDKIDSYFGIVIADRADSQVKKELHKLIAKALKYSDVF